ncbi:MAG: hypothetical protein RR739_01760 [Clostridia bacterium]
MGLGHDALPAVDDQRARVARGQAPLLHQPRRPSGDRRGEKTLGKDGRIVVRVSGTEPLIRVMTEGEDEQLIEQIAREIAAVVEQQLT